MSIYPAAYESLVGFRYISNLHLKRSIKSVQTRRDNDADYIVGEHYRARVKVRGTNGETYWHCICVPKGYITDLVSVPSFGRLFVGRVGPHLEACIFHDWLYEAWVVLGVQPKWSMKKFADDVVRIAMKEANVSKTTRACINLAVGKFGGKEFRKTRRELKITIPKIDTIIELPKDSPERDQAIEYLKKCVCRGNDQHGALW